MQFSGRSDNFENLDPGNRLPVPLFPPVVLSFFLLEDDNFCIPFLTDDARLHRDGQNLVSFGEQGSLLIGDHQDLSQGHLALAFHPKRT